MADLILPRRFNSQPQRRVELDTDNPFAKRIIVGAHGGSGFRDIKSHRYLAPTSGYTQGAGVYKTNKTAGNKIDFGMVAIPSAGFTIIARLKLTAVASHSIFDNKRVSNWTTSKGFELNTRSDEGILFNVGTALTYNNTASLFPVGATRTIAAVFKPGVRQDVYLDGVEIPYSSKTIASSYVQATDTLISGAYYDQVAGAFSTSSSAEFEYVYLFAGDFDVAEIRAVSEKPWQLFRRPPLPVFFGAAGGSTHDLAASSGAQADGSASPSANVALAGIGVALAFGSAAAAVAVDLAAVGASVASGSAALASGTQADLGAAGTADATGAAGAAVTVSIAAAGLAQAAATAGLSADVLIAGAAAAQAGGNAVLAATLSALADGAAQATGGATLSGGAAGELAAPGASAASGAAALSVTVSITADGLAAAVGSAALTGGSQGDVTADGSASSSGSGVLSVSVSLTAAGFVHAMGVGVLHIVAPLAAFASAQAAGAATLSDASIVLPDMPQPRQALGGRVLVALEQLRLLSIPPDLRLWRV